MHRQIALRVGGFWLGMAVLCASAAQAQPPESTEFKYRQGLFDTSRGTLERNIDVGRLLRAEPHWTDSALAARLAPPVARPSGGRWCGELDQTAGGVTTLDSLRLHS
jgi:hypothetical protein